MTSAGDDRKQLIRQALQSDETVNRLEVNGMAVEIEHQPEPGIDRWVRDSASTSAGDWVAFVTSPVDTKPQLYPDSLPFIANAGATLRRMGDTTLVAWHPPDGRACSVEVAAPPDALNDVTAQLLRLNDERKRQGRSSAEMAGEVEAVFESLDPDTFAEINRYWESLRVDPETEEWLDRVFDAAVEASRADGWQEVEVREPVGPIHMRSVVMSRGSLQRTVIMQAMSGATVMLSEQPAE